MNRLAVTYFEKMLHEMNGPITTIYLLSDLMLSNSNVKLDKRNNRENLRSIYEAAKKLSKMVNLLSTITNFQSDTINIQLNKCDLIELVKEEVKYHQVRNKNSSLILKFQNRTSSYYSIVDNFKDVSITIPISFKFLFLQTKKCFRIVFDKNDSGKGGKSKKL